MMNKFKILSLGFLALFGFSSFCSSVNISDNLPIILSGSTTIDVNTAVTIFDLQSYYTGGVNLATYCIRWTSSPAPNLGTSFNFGFSDTIDSTPRYMYSVESRYFGQWVCFANDKRYLNTRNLTGKTISYEVFNLNDLLNTEISYSGYILESEINQEYCVGNNLCPACSYSGYITQEQCNEQYSGYIQQSSINSEYCLNHNLCYSCPTINKGYCKSEYNLIEPTECPICEGSGEINWSSLYINGQQINSNNIIDITTEDQMITDIEYENTVVDIDITYGQNEEYINTIIDQEKITPTKEDIAYFIEGLANYIPLIFVGIFLIGIAKILKKAFKF